MIQKLKKIEALKTILARETVVAFSMDIDWASEFVIEKTLDYFHAQDVPVTVFLTHKSDCLKKQLQEKMIKGGIHPNFLPDSSQGQTFDEVIEYCLSLLPEARGFRAHRYFDVNDTIDALYKKGIRYESNICTYLDSIPPFLHRSGMVGFPIFLEDGGYLYQKGSLNYADIQSLVHMPGLKVINIHPMHFILNTPYYSYARDIKDQLTREEYNNLEKTEIEKIRWRNTGVRDFIVEMINDIKMKRIKTAYIDDIYEIMEQL